MIYFIADTHFNHKMLIDQGHRKFKDVNEMNLLMIKNWLEVVKDEDFVYVLGDVSWGNSQEMKGCLQHLTGNKILVMGSHDQGKTLTWWKNAGFFQVHKNLIQSNSLTLSGFSLYLSHEPMVLLPENSMNIHGHLHKSYFVKREEGNRFWFNVSVEETGYKPVELVSFLSQAKFNANHKAMEEPLKPPTIP